MFLECRIIKAKRIIGKRIVTKLNSNQVFLWQEFMKERHAIKNPLTQYIYSIEVFSADFFKAFNPDKEYEKWAALEVESIEEVPFNFESLIIPGGLYAVFIHKGKPSEGTKTFKYIFEEWLPKSGYELDQRPHFAEMGKKYKNNSDDSEEEIFIPVKPG